MGHFSMIDIGVLVVYFGAMLAMGWHFSRRANSTERYFVGGRAYPGWLIGFSIFGASISSITFVAYPADAFKTGYLRYIICLMLPVAALIASRFFIPFFRRGKIISVFEYLEGRYGPKTRVYGATVFIIAQCFRISMIQYLVALLFHSLTGWDVRLCIVIGGVVTAYYTIAGGIEAVIWTDFIQSMLLTGGGLLILVTILLKLPDGIGQFFSVANEHGKFLFTEADAQGQLRSIPWGVALSQKTVIMLLIVGLFQWLAEYSTNQEVIQKYCAAKSANDARRAMWISCWLCVPTWGYFMLVGTGLFVFYHVFPDSMAEEMRTGARKAEEVLPYFVSTQLPPGLAGIVVAAVLAAAMSSMSSSMNSISAVATSDLYRRHLRKNENDRHYVFVARLVTLVSSVIMIGGAYLLFQAETNTLQDFWAEIQGIIAGGLVGLFMLGFFSTRGDGRAVGAGIVLAVVFSSLVFASARGWLPVGMTELLDRHFDSYYTGVVGNAVMFATGYALALLLPRRPRDLTNLTVWTQDNTPLD